MAMFGEVAALLLKMMGHSSTAPGTLRASEVRPALARLQRGFAAVPDAKTADPTRRPDTRPHHHGRSRCVHGRSR